MKKIYTVQTATNELDLIKKVEHLLNSEEQLWQLQGGVSVATKESGSLIFAQALFLVVV